MTVLARKLGRDLWRLKGQVLTIALVLACGIMAMIMLRGTFGSLVAGRDAYYAEQRMADVFARLERAPEAVAARLERIPGVARVATRVVEDVMVPIPDEPEPVTGRVVSIPANGVPPLCGLFLRAGRLPAPGAGDEVLILEQFARAHGIGPGDPLPVVLNGVLRRLRVVGVALSPEYMFAMRAGELMADDRRFAVIWMPRDAMAPAFRMEAAFDDVLLSLQPGASLPAVLDAVDRELAGYGGRHAVGRDRQLSNYVLTNELEQLRTLALMIPTIFLVVAAFLVNVVISRLVTLERTQIAIFKALGRGRGEVAFHYLGLVALIVGLGSILGVALGIWSGRWMTGMYTGFFRFPSGRYLLTPALVVATVGIALAAATTGALAAVRRVSRLPAAQAMRPPAPPSYRTAFGRPGRSLGPTVMMIAREIARRPARFLMSTAAIAMGVGIFIMGRFSWDSFDRLIRVDFLFDHHEDLTVALAPPARPERVVRELAHLPGVELAEGSRTVAVRFHAGSRWHDSAIIGLPYPSELRRLHHRRTLEVAPPRDGLMMTDALAERLGLGVGDRVDVEIFEGTWDTRPLTLTALIDEPMGLQAYARADTLGAFLREEPRVSSVSLRVDPARLQEVRARLKEMPAVIGTSSVSSVIDRYQAQTGKTMFWITLILTFSAAAIAVGVVYNNARIALSQRGRDLASLRVLGLTRGEISAILLGELGAQVLCGIPLGLWFGYLWAKLYAAAATAETMRFPFHIELTTYATAAVIALLAGLVSALLVRRKLDHLDLVAVLKATE
jgi:putative ABC transport system permease protein